MPAQSVFLLPGEATFVRKPTMISTLLGSCVAVCLYDAKNKWGGMNHYMLPRQTGSGELAPGKYGDFAITNLVEVALKSGSLKGNLVVSLYGGGRVVGHLGAVESTGAFDIGRRNIEVAHELLKQLQIRIVRQEVGGESGRKIHMNSETNEITMRPIQQSEEVRGVVSKREQFKRRKIRVLVIDDSATVRSIIRRGIAMSSDMEVVGEAANPYEAREQILEVDPDVLCLDIIMPRLDGHAFLKKVMQYKPIPTVIVSTIAKRGSEMRSKVMQAGAVDVIDKEELELYKGMDILERVLLPKLRNAAQTNVRKRMRAT